MAKALGQLVLGRDRVPHVVANRGEEEPRAFARGDVTVPTLGTGALARIAASSDGRSWHLTDVELRDRAHKALDERLDAERREALVEALRVARIDLVPELLDGERGPFSITAIELVTDRDETIRVGELGNVESDSLEAAERFISSVWPTVRRRR